MKTSVAFSVFEHLPFILVVHSHLLIFFLLSTLELVPVYEVVACVVGRIYVPTDFDTKEKAFSGAKTAEKGIK